MVLRDDTLRLLSEGYAFLPNRRRETGRDVLDLRLFGRPAVAAYGEDWIHRFYDETYFERSAALPEPVRSTLIGEGAVHSLDGAEHRHRKDHFLDQLGPTPRKSLLSTVEEVWDEETARWTRHPEVSLLDEAAFVLFEGVWSWVGLPPSPTARQDSQDMVAMVDAFGSVGPRQVRGRLARRRQERRLTAVITLIRSGELVTEPDSVLQHTAGLTDLSGERLDPHTCAVELLNIIRPTVAVAWFVAYAGHALALEPGLRPGLAEGSAAATHAFAQELRRFYPFAPFVGARARQASQWGDVRVQAGDLALLDIYGQHHDPALWEAPYWFRPDRFADEVPATLVPQGGGPMTGHRCPGEPATVDLLETLLPRLAALDYDLPSQDSTISLNRVPARPREGLRISVRP